MHGSRTCYKADYTDCIHAALTGGIAGDLELLLFVVAGDRSIGGVAEQQFAPPSARHGLLWSGSHGSGLGRHCLVEVPA